MQDILSPLQSQIDSLKTMAIGALEYHYANYKEHEKHGNPNAGIDDINKFPGRWQKSKEYIKYDLMAYLSQLRRVRFFIRNMQERCFLEEPVDDELNRVWKDLMDKGGVVEQFANKWVAHRSVDDPKRGDSEIQWEVMLNWRVPLF